ncbi:MAG: DUF2269 family protein [Acidimicrobiia bacterium]|nr:DUF2269 family protein [Acidimicrobiia bacterium]
MAYELALVVHIVATIVGYGSTALDTVHAARTNRFQGLEAYAVARATYSASVKVAQPFLYLLVIAGVVAVLTHPGDLTFAAPWISAAFAVYLASIGLLHGVVNRARREALVLSGSLAGEHRDAGPQSVSDLSRLGRRMVLGGIAVDLLAVIGVGLMVWQPGGNG